MNNKKFITVNALVGCIFILSLALQPILISNIDLDDTMLLANLGWRGINGQRPVLDFPHLYSGVAAQYVSWAFYLFDVSFRAINFALLMMFASSFTILGILCFRRLSFTRFSILGVLSAALTISLVPLEVGRIAVPTIGHSFSYNHFAIVIMMALTVFALIKVKERNTEYVCAVFAGFAVAVLILLKPTFSVFGLAVLLACMSQSRWISSVLILLGTMLSMTILDPGMQRTLGSLDFLLNSDVGQRASVTYFLKKSINLIVQQALPIIIVLAIIYKSQKNFTHFIFPVFLISCGYGAAVLTINAIPDLILMPFLVTVGIISTSFGYFNSSKQSSALFTWETGLPIAMAYVYIASALVSAIAAFALSTINSNSSLLPPGVKRDYVVISPLSSLNNFRPITSETSLKDNVEAIIQKTLSPSIERYEYVMFADGLNLLKRIPKLKKYGIISAGRMFDFSMPYQSPPVASYPSWPTASLPYFKEHTPLADDVAAVMITKIDTLPGLLNNELINKMGDDFKVCDQTKIWILYVRSNFYSDVCSIYQQD